MDIKTLLDNLHEEVSCSVCMTTFTDPKMLPCLHSFCLHCLNGILQTSGRHDIIACPECRGEVQVPRGGNLRDLPTNFRINSLLDVLAIKECDTTGVKCGNCDNKTSQSFYCFQCVAFWCEANCISLHNGIKANKEHRVLALKDFKDEDFENVLKRPVFCRKAGHEKKELEFFCKVCEVAICSACALTDHEGHARKRLDEAENERKIQVKAAIDARKEKMRMNKNQITKLDENCRKTQQHAANVETSVQQFADEMIAVIEAKKQEIISEVKNQEKESLQLLGMKRNEIEQEVKMMEIALEKAETLLKRSLSTEIMQPNNFIEKIVQQELKQSEPVVSDNKTFLEFDFSKNQKLLDYLNAEKIGFLTMTTPQQSSADGKGIRESTNGLESTFVLTTRNSKGEQCYEERDCITVEIKNQQHHDCATEVQVKDNKDGSFKVRYFAIETGRCHVSVQMNGEHVLDSPYTVQVQCRQFRPVLSFGQKGSSAGKLSRPWGVAVNERNEIAVTEIGNHRVQVFSSDGTYLRSFGRKGDKQGKFNWPAGIAFDKNENIMVVDGGNHRVQSFSGQGDRLSLFGNKGNLDHQLMFPCGISVDFEGKIIVADSVNKLIKIFSPSGQLLHKFGAQGSLAYPFHCVQYDKYLIASDKTEHCIKVFGLDGTFLYKFGEKGTADGEFNEPCCLSVNKAGHLMVCDTMNHRVQVFDLNGNFIAKFGMKGSGAGEFNKPVSIAVLSDGRVVVTDFCNDRIQIFE